MSFADLVPLVLSIPTTVGGARSATEAWALLKRDASAYAAIDPAILAVNIDLDTAIVAHQLRAVFARAPEPAGLRLLYFGLFAAATSETGPEEAGYYVAGSTHDLADVQVASDLVGPVLDYRPDAAFIYSQLLEQIKTAALSSEATYAFYDYGLMLGGAAILSRFALRQLGVAHRLVVGFDSGDVIELPA